jgi:hypothetical protein
MGTIIRLVVRTIRFVWRRISDAFTTGEILDWLDLKTFLYGLWGAICGFVAMVAIAPRNTAGRHRSSLLWHWPPLSFSHC